MSIDETPELPFDKMFERHAGLTEAVASSYLEAARVCLDKHHTSPVEFRLKDDSHESGTLLKWDMTDERTKNAWANIEDATRDGAYAVALASTELSRKLVAVSRAETKTGADYYVAPIESESDDMEDWLRLEVSGTNLDEYQVQRRLTEKVTQAKSGNSNLPALAAVVGFKVCLISLKSVDESNDLESKS